MLGDGFGRVLAATSAMLLASCATADAQETSVAANGVTPQTWAASCKPWDKWDKPAPPFKIHGNTYYVGTCGIASILIVGDGEHILIDSGTEKGAEVVLENIKTLGINANDIKFILYSHEHFDHVGGHARIKQVTGATAIANAVSGPVFETGVSDRNDPQFGMHDPMEPVEVKTLEKLRTVMARGLVLNAIETPGHSPGALSWYWKSCESGACNTIVYADSLSPVSSDTYKFSEHPQYLAEFRTGLARLERLDCDMLLTPHPSHSKMVKRAATGSFEGGVTCKEYAAGKVDNLKERLAKEMAAKASGQ